MAGTFLLKLQDYGSIITILCKHLKQKWKNYYCDFVTFNLVLLAGVILSIISTILYGHPETFIEMSLFYAGTILFSLFLISVRQKRLIINRVIYEIRYVCRIFMFMVQCYRHSMDKYLSRAKDIRKDNDPVFDTYNMIVISTIFKKLFSMYFDTIDSKNKNPEPYLIDVQEMTDIYTSKEFNNFYSKIFFNMDSENGKTSYELVIIKILDEVMSQLYTKSWFVDYYTDEMVTAIIKYILNNWYKSMAQFESAQPLNEAFV